MQTNLDGFRACRGILLAVVLSSADCSSAVKQKDKDAGGPKSDTSALDTSQAGVDAFNGSGGRVVIDASGGVIGADAETGNGGAAGTDGARDLPQDSESDVPQVTPADSGFGGNSGTGGSLGVGGIGGASGTGGQGGSTYAQDAPSIRLGTATAIVGPTGNTLELPNGVLLVVPPGALPSETVISCTLGQVPIALQDVQREGRLGFVATFEPEGLVFEVPAQLFVPVTAMAAAPTSAASLDFLSIPAQPLDPANEEGDPQPDILHSTQDSLFYNITVPHFSSVAAVWGVGGPLKNLQSCATATTDTKGVSLQVFGQYQANGAGLEQLVPSKHLVVNDPLGGYLQHGAVVDINAAAAELTGSARIVVNWAWRSLPTAYVTAHACPKAAPVGSSYHGEGAAIDVELASGAYKRADCIAALDKAGVAVSQDGSVAMADHTAALAVIAPSVGAALEGNNIDGGAAGHFKWYGCGDPPHFTWTPAGAPPDNVLANEAFQQLWNVNDPCFQLAINGAIINGTVEPNTLAALGESPSGGFDHTAQQDLPVNGVQGAGCELVSNASGSICCPSGVASATPSCQVSCNSTAVCGNGVVEPGEQCDCGTDPKWLPFYCGTINGGCVILWGGAAQPCTTLCTRGEPTCVDGGP